MFNFSTVIARFHLLALMYFALGLLCAETSLALDSRVQTLLENYCLECHDADSAKGDLDLDALDWDHPEKHPASWEAVIRQLHGRVMPPIEKERPSDSEYTNITSALETILDADAEAHPHPGRTETFRRLTRKEYQNAIRDLLTLDIDAKLLLPADSASHGFDNVTVGDLPPALLNRYISASQKISALALGRTGTTPDSRTVRLRPDITQDGHVEGLPLGTRGGALIRHHFPRDGEYDIRIHLMRDRNEEVEGLGGKATHDLQVLIDGKSALSFTVSPPKNGRNHNAVDANLHSRIKVRAGKRELAVTFVQPPPDLLETKRQPYESAFNVHRHPRRYPAVFQVTITGPYEPGGPGDTASRSRVFGDVSGKDDAAAKEILQTLLHRAYRGHADDGDLERALAFYREGKTKGARGFDAGIESALSAILVSPKFLFRVERDPGGLAPGTAYRVSALDLASRLSFFVWSSIPDDVLLAAAAEGELDTSEGVARQARRLLADPRAESLAENFATQWLQLRQLDAITPDGRLYPDFDDNLRQAMRSETELLFNSVLRDDQSVLELLHSERTFLNERLAKHYGISHIYGDRFRPVKLSPDSPRGGILGHAGILTVTSYANRTSPVLRGHWVMENIMGTPPPPAPPDVPALEDNTVDQSLPIRERLAAHREKTACAHCHNFMDPIGFAFENFDAIGQWRTHEGEATVNATGALPDGTPFDGVAELKKGLLARPELFVRTLTEKLLTYGLGRGIEPADAPAIRRIVRAAAEEDYRFSKLFVEITTSTPFIMRETAR